MGGGGEGMRCGALLRNAGSQVVTRPQTDPEVHVVDIKYQPKKQKTRVFSSTTNTNKMVGTNSSFGLAAGQDSLLICTSVHVLPACKFIESSSGYAYHVISITTTCTSLSLSITQPNITTVLENRVVLLPRNADQLLQPI